MVMIHTLQLELHIIIKDSLIQYTANCISQSMTYHKTRASFSCVC